MNDARDKDRSGRVTGIEVKSALGMLFRFFKAAFAIGTRRFVQLVLGSYFVNERAAGSRAGKQNQDRCRADPGGRESHFRLAPLLAKKSAPRFPKWESNSAEEHLRPSSRPLTKADRQPAGQ